MPLFRSGPNDAPQAEHCETRTPGPGRRHRSAGSRGPESGVSRSLLDVITLMLFLGIPTVYVRYIRTGCYQQSGEHAR